MVSKSSHSLTGNPAVLKRVNRVRILRKLRTAGLASRAQLARRTGLDAKTVTNIVNSLLDDKLVVCHDVQAHGRGRPSEKVELNGSAAFSLGLDIGAQQVTAVLIDFRGQVRTKCWEEFGIAKDRRFILKKAGTALDKLMSGLNRRELENIVGMGVCVPGFLDRNRGIVVKSVNIPGLAGFELTRELQDRYGFPVILEESSRAAGTAEIWFDDRRDGKDFICLNLDYGIGMAILHQGRLYRGANEVSGEIGHTVVQPKGIKCTCGKRGCLETIASGRALAGKAKQLKLNGRGIKLKGAKAIFKAAAAGNEKAKQTLCQAGEFIGTAVANVINLFDPEFVILNGGLVGAGELLIDPLKKAVKTNCIRPFDVRYMIEVSELGQLAGALGAAMLPLQKYFEFENIRF